MASSQCQDTFEGQKIAKCLGRTNDKKNENYCETSKYSQYFVNWLDKWSTISAKDKLTKETFTALHHTTTALLEISEYCLEELNANYLLSGKFQTDCMETKFGQFRQLAGGQHNVSLRQIYECEKKLRFLAVLKLKVSGKILI